jgi:hypothetical protein
MDNSINEFNITFINMLFNRKPIVINRAKYVYRKGLLNILKYTDIYKIIRINILLLRYNEIIISNIRFHKLIFYKDRIKRIEHGLSDLISKFDYEKISLISASHVKHVIKPVKLHSNYSEIENGSCVLLIDTFNHKHHYNDYYQYLANILSNIIINKRLYVKTKSNINLQKNLFEELINTNDVSYLDGRYPIEYLLHESSNIKLYSCLSSASVYSKILNPGIDSYSYHNHNLEYCSKHNLEPSIDLVKSIDFIYNQLGKHLQPKVI